MPTYRVEGKLYRFPEGTTLEEAQGAIESITTPAPSIIPAINPTTPPNWRALVETPEVRRQRAADSFQLLTKEAATLPQDQQGVMQYLMNRENLISTAADPHKVARAKKPETTYTRYINATR